VGLRGTRNAKQDSLAILLKSSYEADPCYRWMQLDSSTNLDVKGAVIHSEKVAVQKGAAKEGHDSLAQTMSFGLHFGADDHRNQFGLV
jgi:hypothetical protein